MRTSVKGSKALNVAIIGCGRIGEREAAAVVTLPELRLVAVSDIGPAFREKALRLADRYECDSVHDWRYVVRRDDIDIVIISTPTSFHTPIGIEALRHGKHVLCEKPLAATPADAEAMVRAAKTHRVKLMTNFNHRRHEHNERAKRLLDEGLIGGVTCVRGRIGHGRFILGPSPCGPGRFQCQNSWYTNAAMSGGGALIDNGVHLLDLARWFIGDELVEAKGTVTRNLDVLMPGVEDGREGWHPSECEDNGFGLFTTADGRTAMVHSSWVQWQGYLHIEIFGTHGGIVVNNDQLQGHVSYHRFGRHQTPISSTTEIPALLQPDPSWRLQLLEFVGAIREDREPSPSGFDGLMAARMVQAVYRSAQSDQGEPIETGPPSDTAVAAFDAPALSKA